MPRDRLLTFSITLAWLLGILIPLAETIRRWGIFSTTPIPAWLDDYLMGAFLLIGAAHASHDPARGRACLAAAWSFCTAMVYCSFFGHLQHFHEPDPSRNFTQLQITIAVGAGLATSLLALVMTLISRPEGAGRQ